MIILIILILVLILTLFLINKTFKKKDNILDEVKLQENDIKNDGFALMLQQSDGTYEESKSSSWPTDMVFNSELSGCIDAKGNKIDNSLTYANGVVTLSISSTSYCYVYFDQADNNFAKYLINNVSSSELWDSPLEGDGYRYVGEYEYDMEYSTVISPGPSNYICFGTTNKSKCLSNPDTYMYRIIGIFEDEDGDNHLKLIKKTALDTTYQWASDAYSNIDFTGSEILNGLSSSYFMTNTSYPYMQNTNWKNMIELWDYKYANTKTFEYYQQNYKENDSNYTGPSYSESNVLGIYLHELNRSNKNVSGALYAYTYQDSAVYPELPSHTSYSDPNIGEWGWEHTEVSLMYVSDYALSLGSDALEYISKNDYSKLKKGWIHLSNNDSSAPASNEWTMTKFGQDPIHTGSYYDAWSISSLGTIDYTDTSDYLSYRPVFYLKSDAKYGSGTGTSSDPYIIDMGVDTTSAASEIILGVSSNELWKSTLEGDGYRYIGTNPNNYICFGTNDWENCIYTKDKYMYRIIGVFEDSEGNNHLKLIKYNALDNASYYYSDYSWLDSDYSDEIWGSKISTWNYTVTNTKTYDNGPDYNSITIKDLYLHELNRSSKTSSVGEWSSYSGKIGVMYASDYALSLGSKALNYTVSSYASTLATGWMYLSNNDSNPPESQEWTLSSSDGYNGWYIDYNLNDSSRAVSIRPVFYLNSDVEFTYEWIGSSYSGDGTIKYPYMLK